MTNQIDNSIRVKNPNEVVNVKINQNEGSRKINYQKSFLGFMKKTFTTLLTKIANATNYEDVYAKADIVKSKINHLEDDKKELNSYLNNNVNSDDRTIVEKQLKYIDEDVAKLSKKYNKLDKRGDTLFSVHETLDTAKDFVIKRPIEFYGKVKQKVKKVGDHAATIKQIYQQHFKEVSKARTNKKEKTSQQTIKPIINDMEEINNEIIYDNNKINANNNIENSFFNNVERPQIIIEKPTKINNLKDSNIITDQNEFPYFEIPSFMEQKKYEELPEEIRADVEKLIDPTELNSNGIIKEIPVMEEILEPIIEVEEVKPMEEILEPIVEVEEVKPMEEILEPIVEVEEVKPMEEIFEPIKEELQPESIYVINDVKETATDNNIATIDILDSARVQELKDYMVSIYGENYDELTLNDDNLAKEAIEKLDDYEKTR